MATVEKVSPSSVAGRSVRYYASKEGGPGLTISRENIRWYFLSLEGACGHYLRFFTGREVSVARTLFALRFFSMRITNDAAQNNSHGVIGQQNRLGINEKSFL